MRRAPLLLLGLLFVLAPSGAQSGAVRGAAPGFSASSLSCAPLLGGAPAVLPAARVNDDFCDCADGSDEPGTSACARGRFWCAGAGGRGHFIPSSRVDDGVCDCCDGSDEPSGKCPDSCAARHAEAVAQAEREAKIIRHGVRVRAQYARDAAREARKDAASLRDKRRRLGEVRGQLKRARRQVEALRAREAIAPAADEAVAEMPAEDGVPPEMVGEDAGGAEEEAERPPPVDVGDGGEADKVHGDALVDPEVPTVPGPVDVDAPADAVPEDLPVGDRAQEGIEGGEGAGTDKDITANDATAAPAEDLDEVCATLSANMRGGLAGRLQAFGLRLYARVRRLLPPKLRGQRSRASDAAVDRCVQHAEDRQSTLEEEERTLSSAVEDLERKRGFNYGADGALRKLHGACVRKRVAQYEFEHCPFDCVRQYEGGTMIASLGRFENVSANNPTVMAYANGDGCWNGPSRSVAVELRCGETDEVVGVDEPSRCRYTMMFATPAACEEGAAQRLLDAVIGGGVKDEL